MYYYIHLLRLVISKTYTFIYSIYLNAYSLKDVNILEILNKIDVSAISCGHDCVISLFSSLSSYYSYVNTRLVHTA